MKNVYIAPPSAIFLSNALFETRKEVNLDDRLLPWRYLKKYLKKRDIDLNTIDFWSKEKSNSEDVYVALDHKNFFRKFFRRFREKKYPKVNLENFKKRILFQVEPPVVMPEVYINIGRLSKIYDEMHFALKINNSNCKYFYIPRPYNDVLVDFWNKKRRKFLIMINVNKKPPLFQLSRFFQNKRLFSFEKELIGERLKIIDFFAQKGELDLYGPAWEKTPPFPYWGYKKSAQKALKGKWVDSKYEKLSEYNFAIAFENSINRGFIGEALFDCFYAGTVPIYLGASDIEKHIPENCFIDFRKFKNYEELRNYIKSLSEPDIEKYKENARRFLKSEKYKPFTKEYFAQKFFEIVTN